MLIYIIVCNIYFYITFATLINFFKAKCFFFTEGCSAITVIVYKDS